MSMFRTHRTVAVLTLGALLITACGSDGERGSDEVDADAPIVVATMSIWGDIASNVACDGLARVETIIPPGGDPHAFEPSLSDRETMDNADLVVANGLFLEESLIDSIEAVESNGVPVLRLADELDPLPMGEYPDDHDDDGSEKVDDHENETDADHEADADHADDPGGSDPHVWWDPSRVAVAVPMIADALADAGVDRAALDACAEAYIAELTALDADVTGIVAPLALDERLLVTNHDSLGYFAERYDFEVLGSVIPSSSSLAATSPAELDTLADEIGATGVTAIFADTQTSSTDADALADRIGDVEVVSILTDTLDEPGSDAGTYVGWLRANAQIIVDALTRNGAS